MRSKFHNLDGSQIASLDDGAGGQRDLREADGTGVGVLGRAEQLEGRDHGVGHVHGTVVGSVGAEAQVDVEEGRLVALEPSRLECDGAAGRRPVGPVGCGAYSAA